MIKSRDASNYCWLSWSCMRATCQGVGPAGCPTCTRAARAGGPHRTCGGAQGSMTSGMRVCNRRENNLSEQNFVQARTAGACNLSRSRAREVLTIRDNAQSAECSTSHKVQRADLLPHAGASELAIAGCPGEAAVCSHRCWQDCRLCDCEP